MFLLIDNYDSFTYNLVQAFYALGQDPVVVKNDDPRLLELAQDPSLNMVCLSPGPGHPKDAGYCMEVLRILDPKVPVLGVCLGHQALGLTAGAEVVVGPCIMHGKASEIVHDGSGLFSGVPNPMRVGRYHSLVVRSDVDEAHAKFTVTAHGPEGEIMALRYKDRPWVGVQFHPESILTPDGLRLLGNFPKAILPAGNDANAINAILDTLANGQDLTRQGWLLSGIAEYKLDYVTPGLIAWYGSGDNSDTMDGSERLPTLSPGWGATTLGWDGAYGISDGAVLSKTPTGTWGVVARLADISFFENLTHTLAVGFYTGTNNTRMVTSGPVSGVESGNVYLTTKDHAWEVNFDSQYKIYENLTLAAEMGFVRLDLDKDVWGSKLSGVDKTAYKVGLNLNYAF